MTLPAAATNNPSRVLIISHDASRTGAPILLLQLVRWLSRASDLDITIVVSERGPLISDFSAGVPTTVVAPRRLVDAVLRRLPRGDQLRRAVRRARAKRLITGLGRFDLVYSNTVMNAEMIRLIGDAPLITHVHEMQQWIEGHVAADEMRTMVARTDRFVAASDAVRENLCQRHGVDPERVTTVETFVDLQAIQALQAHAPPPDCRQVRVGGAGTLDSRKGPDLFMRAAAAMSDVSELDVYFTWIGGDLKSKFAREVRQLAVDLHISDRVTFTGQVSDPVTQMTKLDVFLLTSREDPFPLVMLEAAALGIPIVCFDRTGGAPGFVENDAGTVVGHLDVEAMARAAAELAADPDRRRQAGARGRQKVASRCDVESAGRRVLDLIRRTIAEHSLDSRA